MKRLEIEFPSAGGEWHPGLPSGGTVCDIRPTAAPEQCWGHLLVYGPIEGCTEGKVVVRVPSTDPKRGRLTMLIELDPTKCEWRSCPIPDYPEAVHA